MMNFTTQISATRTVGEIQAMLAKAHAAYTVVKYDAVGQPITLIFEFAHNTYLLPCRSEAILKLLQSNPHVPRSLRSQEQATRVGWRILKDWLAVTLALLEMRLADPEELFMPFMVTNDQSQATAYTVYKEQRALMEKKP